LPFGPPVWTDRSDRETILLYEYQQEEVEVRFEFWNSRTLSHLTLTRNGVLSKEEQRVAYEVTRSWPFKNIQD
jgi:hypothetical protein